MAYEKFECAQITIDRFFDVKYGSENYFEYIGQEAYRAFTKLLDENSQNKFTDFLAKVGYDWEGIAVKIKRYDGVYRDVYVKVCRKMRNNGGEQLWNLEIYDMEMIVDIYEQHNDECDTYITALGLTGKVCFRYNHNDRKIKFFKVNNVKELVIFENDIDYLKNNAVRLSYLSPEDEDVFFNMCDNLKIGKTEISTRLETSLYSVKGELKDSIIRGYTIKRNDKPFITVGTVSAVEAEAATQDNDDMALLIDPLTGLFNKKTIENKIRSSINDNPDGDFTMFILDVDNFKEVNDNCGHMSGDIVLESVAEVISKALGEKGCAGRFGGDEFIGIIYNVKDNEAIRSFLRSIRSKIQYLFEDKPQMHVTCSIGAVRYPSDCDSYEELFEQADKCLYIAKEKGKNRYVIYQKELHGDAHNEECQDHVPAKKKEMGVSVIGEIIEQLYRGGAKAIPEVLKAIVENTNYDRATVYYGDNFEKLYSYGENTGEVAVWARHSDYMGYFNSDGLLKMSNMTKIEGLDREIYDYFVQQHTQCMIQALIKDNEEVKGFLSLECCKGVERFSEASMYHAGVTAKLISEVLRENAD